MFLDQMWLLLLVLAHLAIAGYLLHRLVRLLTADADLQVLGSRLKPGYFNGRVVWITGASSGIGEEMCYQLSKLGAKLILTARTQHKLEEVRNNLYNPENARVLPVDLSDPEATRVSVDKARQLFGRVDMLVNNAGVSTRALFRDLQEHVHRKVMEIDFFAPWILTHGLIEEMIKDGFGHIINISSIWGKAAPSNRSAYSSAKFGLIALMDSIRYEMLDSNVHVTNVAPGPVVTGAGVNALKGDGSKFGVSDNLIATGMSVQRCVEVVLTGVSNQQKEVWVSEQWWLMIPYLSHYCPSLLSHWLSKRARRELEAAKKDK
ncbi:dehydrogenase/reductase SDR family member 7-like isoform X2 [Halichondria panicea]|uniref:dehydrogenase/reductase SDR family member 7-like isoform X2 n=1 Tax=Halichondria panicea TaxID=6063 RepID=UPI00312B718F